MPLRTRSRRQRRHVLVRFPRPPRSPGRLDRLVFDGPFLRVHERAQHMQRNRRRAGIQQQHVWETRRRLHIELQRLDKHPPLALQRFDERKFVQQTRSRIRLSSLRSSSRCTDLPLDSPSNLPSCFLEAPRSARRCVTWRRTICVLAPVHTARVKMPRKVAIRTGLQGRGSSSDRPLTANGRPSSVRNKALPPESTRRFSSFTTCVQKLQPRPTRHPGRASTAGSHHGVDDQQLHPPQGGQEGEASEMICGTVPQNAFHVGFVQPKKKALHRCKALI